jgi:predicted RNA-binding protein with PIN domain
MDVIIDGHNLIGQMAKLSLQDQHKELKLLQHLQAYFGRTRHQVLVAFDRGQLAGKQASLGTPQLQVIFARGIPADTLIKQRIAAHPRPHDLLVVSSDRSIQLVARSCHAQVRTSQEFAKTLQSGYRGSGALQPTPAQSLLSDSEVAEWEALFRQGQPQRDTKPR